MNDEKNKEFMIKPYGIPMFLKIPAVLLEFLFFDDS